MTPHDVTAMPKYRSQYDQFRGEHLVRATLFSAAWLLVPATAGAQIATVQPAISAAAASNAVLHIGTEVPLKLSEDLTTKGKKLKLGQRFHLETAEAVSVQGVVVIPVGSPAIGEITDIRNKGMWGKSGHLSARVLYVTVNDRQIRLTGNFDDKGTAGGIGAAAVSAVVFLPAGFFMTGTSAHVVTGAPVKAFTDEDVPLAFAASSPAPLAVGVPIVAPTASVPTGMAKVSTGK